MKAQSLEGLWEVESIQIKKNDALFKATSLSEYPKYNVDYDFDWNVTQAFGSFSTVKVFDKDNNQSLAVYKLSNDKKSIEIKDNVSTLKSEILKVQEWTKNFLQLSKYDNVEKQTILLSFHKSEL